RIDQLVVHRRLASGALDVHNGRLAGDDNRLLQRADLQLNVDDGDECAAQLDAVALDGGKSRERVRHRITAIAQIDDAELTSRIGDRRAHTLDQSWAGCFDGHA